MSIFSHRKINLSHSLFFLFLIFQNFNSSLFYVYFYHPYFIQMTVHFRKWFDYIYFQISSIILLGLALFLNTFHTEGFEGQTLSGEPCEV